MPELVAFGKPAGGYANSFVPVPPDWELGGTKYADGLIPLRDDLDPTSYASHAKTWIDHGARLIGGCCGAGPEHIAALKALIG